MVESGISPMSLKSKSDGMAYNTASINSLPRFTRAQSSMKWKKSNDSLRNVVINNQNNGHKRMESPLATQRKS